MDEPVRREIVLHELEKILCWEGFSTAPKLQGFLRFIVEETLAGRESEIKESTIGYEVYHKSPGYDPRYDSTVRVEAAKLRQRLDRFYGSVGADSPIRITIPKGTYVPRFEPAVSTPSTAAPPVSQPGALLENEASGFRPWWHWLVAGSVAGVITGGIAGWWGLAWITNRTRPTPPWRVTQLSAFDSFVVEPAVSRDGEFVVYSSDRGTPGVLNLWRQSLLANAGEAIQLTQANMAARMPTLSPDGRRVVFRLEDEGGVLASGPADRLGGAVRIPQAGRGRHPRFSPVDERLVYWVPQDEQTLDRGSVFLLDLVNPSAPGRLFAQFAHATTPIWSDGGTHVASLGTWQSDVPDREYDAWVVEVRGTQSRGEPRKTGLFPLLAARGYYFSIPERSRIELGDWRDGWLYFSAPTGGGENLFRIRLDPGKGVAGAPEPVTTGVGSNGGARLGGGRLVFTNAQLSYGLHSAPLMPQSSDPPRRLTHRLGINLRASVDLSGKWAAWERRGRTAGTQLWLENLETGAGRELAADITQGRAFALVSPDGGRVAYQVLEGTNQAIYMEQTAGSGGSRRRVCGDCGAPSDWNQAGTHILYTTGGQPNGIGILDLGSGRNRTLLDHPSYGLHDARFLVDSKGNGWMALYADTGARTRQIFVAPVHSFAPAPYQEWIPVTDGAHWDLSPAWAPDGGSIYFVSRRDGQRCIWTQLLDPVTRRPVGTPQPVYHFHSPTQTLMQSVTYRGAERLYAAAGRLFFSLDRATSSLWLKE